MRKPMKGDAAMAEDRFRDAIDGLVGYSRDDGEVTVERDGDSVVLWVHGYSILDVAADGRLTVYEHPTMYDV